MSEQPIYDLLIEILSAALCEREADPALKERLTPDVLSAVISLAQKHDLAHILSVFVYRNSIETSPELRGKLQQAEYLAVYRCERLNAALQEIRGAFDGANIAYIPLKGSVLRPCYPYESMRTSCDIDILIHEEDLERAIQALEEQGYRCGDRHYHDVSLYSPGKIHLELHFNIQENMPNLDVVLQNAWQYAVLDEGCRYSFRKEFFAFHIAAHMAYHFLGGGCGIRSLMDVWVMEHRMNIPLSCAGDLLKQAGIEIFSAEMSALANRCFSERKQIPGDEMLLHYIFRGGVYGSMENSMAMTRSRKHTPVTYLWRRLFMPYKSMTIPYPILKKIPVLLPFCWVHRWIKALRAGKQQKLSSEMACIRNVSDDRLAEVQALYTRLGL